MTHLVKQIQTYMLICVYLYMGISRC